MRTTSTYGHGLLAALGATLLAGACTNSITVESDDTTDDGETDNTTGGDDNTFDHDNYGLTPDQVLERLQLEGPPSYRSRVHACPKIRVRSLENLLVSRGVNMNGGGGPTSASGLYDSGQNALGIANYAARVRENIALTTASASRMFDIFAAAAPELIANLDTSPACAGVGPVFDAATNACQAPALTCLMGVPATAGHLEMCDFVVSNAADVETGKQIAVAALMAAAHTCE